MHNLWTTFYAYPIFHSHALLLIAMSKVAHVYEQLLMAMSKVAHVYEQPFHTMRKFAHALWATHP